MKTYIGTIDAPMDWQVRVEDDDHSRPLALRRDVADHSPDGFAWGYGGSGPSQLALAILCDATGNDTLAERLHHAFKFQHIARLDQDRGFTLTDTQVLAWVAGQKP